jgi:replicative DNA helicase
MNELVVPSEMESEIALIGCIFLDESILYQVADMLDIDDFYFHT